MAIYTPFDDVGDKLIDYVVFGDSWVADPRGNITIALQSEFPGRNFYLDGVVGATFADALFKLQREDVVRDEILKTSLSLLISLGGNDIITALHATPTLAKLKQTLIDRLDQYAAPFYSLAAEKVSNGRFPFRCITHSYVYPTQFYKNWFFVGPWIGPILEKLKVSQEDYFTVVEEAMDIFYSYIYDVCRQYAYFEIADIRKFKVSWKDEIHPTMDAYKQLAKALKPSIAATLRYKGVSSLAVNRGNRK